MPYVHRFGCEDGPCPKMADDTDTGDVIVQGPTVDDPRYREQVGPVPGHESVVRIPRAILDGYIARLPRETLEAYLATATAAKVTV